MRQAPTALVRHGFRYHFYSVDRKEPPHVHVWHGGHRAKFWLLPNIVLDKKKKCTLTRSELSKARKILRAEKEDVLQEWAKFFSRAVPEDA